MASLVSNFPKLIRRISLFWKFFLNFSFVSFFFPEQILAGGAADFLLPSKSTGNVLRLAQKLKLKFLYSWLHFARINGFGFGSSRSAYVPIGNRICSSRIQSQRWGIAFLFHHIFLIFKLKGNPFKPILLPSVTLIIAHEALYSFKIKIVFLNKLNGRLILLISLITLYFCPFRFPDFACVYFFF